KLYGTVKKRNRKMRKHKNSVQDEIFLKFMEKQPDIARGFTKGDRIAIDSKWAALAADLNDAGPPTKNVLGWKKVWSDWKGAIRKKLAHNRRETSATGGGPYAQLALSDAEQTVATLCGLYKMIEGDVARAFGVPDTDDAKSPLFSSIGTKRPAEDAPEALASSPSTESAAKRVRRAPVNNLEEICGASNRLMERLVDSLDAIRSNMAAQTLLMEQHFKTMEEIERKKLEALQNNLK
ncbi:hypothetical protein ACLKA6_003085, partial [Drosophila palustris]